MATGPREEHAHKRGNVVAKGGTGILVIILAVIVVVGLGAWLSHGSVGGGGGGLSFGGTEAPIVTRSFANQLYGTQGAYSVVYVKNLTGLSSILKMPSSSINGTYLVDYPLQNGTGTAFFIVVNTTGNYGLANYLSPSNCNLIKFKKDIEYCAAGSAVDAFKNFVNMNATYISLLIGTKYNMTVVQKNNYVIYALLSGSVANDINKTVYAMP